MQAALSGTLVSEAASKRLVELLCAQTRRNKIPAGLPQDVTCGNKTGELADVENDVAIVWTNAGTYLLCVMVEDVTAPGQTQSDIAALSALVLSAMSSERFAFLGFLPDKQGERRRLLEKYAALDLTLIFHAAPQDVDRYIADMYAVFGDRPACAVREITKIHEEALSFTLKEGLPGEKRGEYVLIIGGAEEHNELNSLTEVEHIKHYMAQGLDKKEAIKRVAKDRGVTKSELYKFGIDL